ncbi:hypothetical protein M3Y94_01025200 [Aphelenchoides besseyi]|nr:hypothetical protein M3Y94_01025200 [Aphelenchoides besseyi]KAI6223853.1 hypothetical protein M3Y95_00820400 [Aphelenchoides besseyi]
MTTVYKPPKLAGQAVHAFFRHLIANDNLSATELPLDNRKRAVRTMIVSNSFRAAAQVVLYNSEVDVTFHHTASVAGHSWHFCGFECAVLTDQMALAVFRLTTPQIRKLTATQYWNKTVDPIDPAIIPYLIGIPEYEINSADDYVEYAIRLGETLCTGGHLKLLDCKWETLDRKRGLRSLKADKYRGRFSHFEAPCKFATILGHKFRQIHLEMYLADDMEDWEEDFDWYEPVPMTTFGHTFVIQPAIEEIYLENMANERLEDDPPFLPIKFFKHVPNLKKFFYCGHQDALNDDPDETMGPALYKLIDRLDNTFNYVEKARKEGCNAQFVFAFSARVFLMPDQSEQEWILDLMRLPVFRGIKCELATRLRLSQDPDFQATPTYARFGCRCPSAVLICTGTQLKLFLWPYFRKMPTFHHNHHAIMDAEMHDEDEETDDAEEMDDDEELDENDEDAEDEANESDSMEHDGE